MDNVVHVTMIDFSGEIEKVVNTFYCECGFKDLERGFNYCPACGSRLIWDF